MTIKRLLGCIVLCAPFLTLKGQNGSGTEATINQLSPVIPSPNAASLGEFGEMPVSYFTGVPDITVPLYTVRGNKISLPLSLAYHAGGLRPDIHPGWVGNGWSLEAGGTITRKPNGQIDEYKKSFTGTQGYYWNHADLTSSTWSATSTLSNYGNNVFGQVLPPANPSGVQDPFPPANDVDVEPDEFDFNFLGFTGKFFMDQNGNWQVQSNAALKVIFNPSDFVAPFTKTALAAVESGTNINDMCNTFGRFTIVDGKGNQYVFGSVDANNTAIEFSDLMIPQTGYIGASITATTWFLSQIISADGSETINLSYVRGPMTSAVGYEYSTLIYSIPGGGVCTTVGVNMGTGIFSGSVIAPVYLSSISMPTQNVTLSFNTSASTELNYSYQGSLVNFYDRIYSDAGISTSPAPTDFPSGYTLIKDPSVIPFYATNTVPPINYNRFIWLELNSIRIFNPENGAVLRNITFGYNNNAQKRLQLESLLVKDATGVSIEPGNQDYFSFGYNQTALPAYMTIYGDSWGFNNFTGSNNLGVGYPNSPNFLSYRAPDPTGAQTMAEVLTSIRYPTGGTTTFTYEPNAFSSWVDRTTSSSAPIAQNGIAGGLRIKSITSTDQFNASVTKNYYYVKGYTSTANVSALTSSGVLDSKPEYNFTTTGTTSDGRTFTNTFTFSNSVVPVSSNTMGTFIGYSTVVEQRSDGSYTIFTFSNQDNGYADQAPINAFNSGVFRGFKSFNSLWFERGRLIDKKSYSNHDVLTAEESTTYTLTIPTAVANAVFTSRSTICSFNNVGGLERDAYSMIYSPFMPTATTNTLYTSDGSGKSVASTFNLTYDQYKNLTQSTTTNSKGQTEITTTTYPPELATGDAANPYSLMVNMNNVNSLVEKRINVGGNLASGEIRCYQALGPNKIYLSGVYEYENSLLMPIGSVAATAFNPANGLLAFDPGYVQEGALNYDASGNLSTMTKTGTFPSAYLWDYNGEQVVAKVDNASNIYASSATGVKTENFPAIPVSFSLNTNVSKNLIISASGPVTLTFTYVNPSVASTSQLTWNLYGPTDASGVLCSATATSTTGCGTQSNTVTIPNVLPGNYSLVYDLTSCVGFQNYYGYLLNITFPTNIYTPVTAKNDIGYNSFEYVAANDLNYGTGNWTGISLANVRTGSAVTGTNYYLLTGSTLNKSGLNAGQYYIVSYWSNSGAYSVTGTQATTTGANIATGNWTYYEHLVFGTPTVNVSGTGNIDELRIYPKGSQMTTYTYTPMIGMTSQCDVNNYITSFQYDTFGRLIATRDRDGNLLKEYQYNY